MNTNPSQPTEREVLDLSACAEAVGCRLEQGSFEASRIALPWRFTSPIGPRLYANYAAAQWAVYDEMRVCERLGTFRNAVESSLSDARHPFHTRALAWWRLNTEADDLSPLLQSPAFQLMRAMGQQVALRGIPPHWPEEEREGLIPRGSDSRSLHQFMQYARALASSRGLAANIESQLSLSTPARATPNGRRRL